MVAFLEVGFFPRIHTAIAEWLACMLFILPQKKRFGESSWQQIGCCIGFLALLLFRSAYRKRIAPLGA